MQGTANRSAKIILLCAVFPFFLSCAPRMSLIQTGPWEKRGSAGWRDIPVFHSKSEIKKPWIAIGLFHGEKVLPAEKGKLEKQIRKARKMAAGIGADAVLLVSVSDNSGEDGIARVYLSGLAVKYYEGEKIVR